MGDKRAIREEIIKRAREDKDFYNRLFSNPKSVISELRINNPEISIDILSVTPEAFDKLIKEDQVKVASSCVLITVCPPN